MTNSDNFINISGGSFQGSAIGIGHVEQHGSAIDTGAGLAELRALLARKSDEIVALGRDDDERAELSHELRKIEKEIATPEPDAAAVRTRWKSVLALLEGVLTAGTKIAGITELIQKIFGG